MFKIRKHRNKYHHYIPGNYQNYLQFAVYFSFFYDKKDFCYLSLEKFSDIYSHRPLVKMCTVLPFLYGTVRNNKIWPNALIFSREKI